MNLIALADINFGIGINNEQIVYIPEDLKHFKSLTINKTVILGRKTLSTFPNGKPLKDRKNIILTRNKSLKIEGAEIVYSVEEALKTAPNNSFIIGGAAIYKELLPYADKAYITRVKKEFNCDCYLENLDESKDWILKEKGAEREFEGLKYSYDIYERARNID